MKKTNVQKIRNALKAAKVNSGHLNEDQLTALVVYGIQEKQSEAHNFMVAVGRGVMGIAEPDKAFPVSANGVKEISLEDFYA